MVKQDFQKGDTHLHKLTQHMVYEALTQEGERPKLWRPAPHFCRCTQFVSLAFQCLHISSSPAAAECPPKVFLLSFGHNTAFELFLPALLQLKWTQCRFTTCSNVTQDKKTTAAGYWWQNNNRPTLLAEEEKEKANVLLNINWWYNFSKNNVWLN